MVCVLILFYKFFSFCFQTKKKIFGGGGGGVGWGGGGGGGGGVGFGGGGKEEFEFVLVSPHPRVPSREDVLQRYYEHSVSLLEKLRNKIFRLAIAGYLPFKCYVL